jgi:hypothetical protein
MNNKALMMMLYTHNKAAGEIIIQSVLANKAKLSDLKDIRANLSNALAAVVELERRCIHEQNETK